MKSLSVKCKRVWEKQASSLHYWLFSLQISVSAPVVWIAFKSESSEPTSLPIVKDGISKMLRVCSHQPTHPSMPLHLGTQSCIPLRWEGEAETPCFLWFSIGYLIPLLLRYTLVKAQILGRRGAREHKSHWEECQSPCKKSMWDWVNILIQPSSEHIIFDMSHPLSK